jgi:hypothetical protein
MEFMDHSTLWQTGIAVADITPREPIALAGWGGRRISEGALHPLWAKALALQDAHGTTGVLVTTDLLGLSRAMSEELASRAERKFGLRREQLIINSSHNHAGPVTGDLLHLYYELSPAELEVIDRYTDWLLDRIESVIGAALQDLQPSTLCFEQGLCGFGVNRRRDQRARAEYSNARALQQVVDHDVPVLAVRDENQNLRSVVFGYTCHPTSYAVPKASGDFPGVAQIEIEKQYPGATAFYVAGCGGDINPLPRFGRYHEALTEMYGKTLAAGVCNVLDAPMKPLASALKLGFREATLSLQAAPDRAALEAMRQKSGEGIKAREIEYQLQELERGPLASEVPFPMHCWRLGELNFIALSGEPVVDYALRFKQRYGTESTWVAGYCNELTAYIPSHRVLAEGGYEGSDGMMEYGWPAPFAHGVEDVIAKTVDELLHHVQ